MQKGIEENKSSPKSLNMNHIIIALILVILILSLLINFLILSKLSNISGNLHSQDLRSVWGNSDGIISEQEQELSLQMNPVLNKIRHIQQQIINREVIKDDDLIGVSIDSQIKEDIKIYNELVPELKGFFAEEAIKTLIGVFQLENEDGEIYYEPHALNYLDIPSDVREYAEIITDLSLYKNCTQLLRSDSRMAFFIYVESGGSAGRWPYIWHTEFLHEYDNVKEDLNRLFVLVERIITSLDKEYENLYFIELERRFPISE